MYSQLSQLGTGISDAEISQEWFLEKVREQDQLKTIHNNWHNYF